MKRYNFFKTFWILSFLCFTLINPNLSCRPGAGYVMPTIEEQTEKASAIVKGIVKKVREPKSGIGVTVVLKQAKFIKGCGPKRLVISNFRSTAACGAGIPEVGDTIMVFVCPKRKRKIKRTRFWKVNQIAIGAGMINVKYQIDDVNWIQDKIREEYGELGLCESQGECLARIDE